MYERGSERWKSLRRRVRTSKVFLGWSERRKSKRSQPQKFDHNVENHFVEKNIESQTFDVLIFLDTIA
jgi:DNA-binding transcriptional regulator PaaX